MVPLGSIVISPLNVFTGEWGDRFPIPWGEPTGARKLKTVRIISADKKVAIIDLLFIEL